MEAPRRRSGWGRVRGVAAALFALYCLDGFVRKGWLKGQPDVRSMPEDERMPKAREIAERLAALPARPRRQVKTLFR